MNETVQNPFPVAADSGGALAQANTQREVAEVQAAMVIAKKFPRDPREAMDRILMACTRPRLADQAVYQYARGGQDVTGPSIRLAEELARGWGNILCGVTELSRANGVSECLAYAWDLETNFRDEKRFHVKHWRDTKKGGYALKDERDIYELIANQGARRKRACILAVIPGDVQEAAVQQCDLTLKTTAELTPERLQSMLDKFSSYGVTREHIEKRIQRKLDSMTPALFISLGKIYNSLRDGMSTPHEWFDLPKPQEQRTTLSEITGADKLSDEFDSQPIPGFDDPEPLPAEPEPEPEPAPPETPPAPAGRTKPDTLAMVAKIGKAKNLDQLASAWTHIQAAYGESGVPRPVTSAYEQAGKALKGAGQ